MVCECWGFKGGLAGETVRVYVNASAFMRKCKALYSCLLACVVCPGIKMHYALLKVILLPESLLFTFGF